MNTIMWGPWQWRYRLFLFLRLPKVPSCRHSLLPDCSLGQATTGFRSYSFAFLDCHSYKWNQRGQSLCIWLLLLSIMLLKSTHSVAQISNLFLFAPEQYSVVWIYHSLSIRHSMNIEFLPGFSYYEENFYKLLLKGLRWTQVFISLQSIPGSGITRPCGI